MQILLWLADGDTGVSSETLAFAAVGIMRGGFFTEPGDTADCGRCERLVRRLPWVADALPELAKRNPRWNRWAPRIQQAATEATGDAA
jgi:hypothetical protein